ncbi:hypothetical protein PtA15_5A431 [Puccinia triticina]|nr:uncharacterized protein PtA15_5A431 [Puccinia triticina]WAQ84858.1 hypothetical protein PtA15_5A431 [Puccinia triticina]WAR58206.1 hypothetical protein PtB15_5B438 [Puccinia triticina]
MPARANLAPDDRMKDWLSSQIDTFQDFLNRLASPIFTLADQAIVVLSYLNPFTYIFLLFNFFYRLCVSPHTHRSILGSIILGFIFVISLLLSIIAYITFYRAYVPHVGFRLPVWLQYGEARVPYAAMDLSSIAPEITVDQAYDVHLLLTVPTNDRNMNLGNFMVHFSLVTTHPHNTTLHQSSRHASLIYEPGFARVLHGFKYLRTLFFLSSPPSVQHIRVPLLEHRIIHPTSLGKRTKIAYAKIEVGRQDVYSSPTLLLERDGWGELQIYKATLAFDAHLEGLRWALYYHPYISFCFFSAFFFIAELMAVFITWGTVLYREAPSKPTKSSSFPKVEPYSGRQHSSASQDRPKVGTLAPGTTEVDSSSTSENDPRSLEDDDDREHETFFEEPPRIKTEVNDDGVLVGSSRDIHTDPSTSGPQRHLTHRKSSKTSRYS